MSEPRIIAVFDDYAGLIGASRARLAEIGMTYETLDEIAGWHEGYASKILPWKPKPTQDGKRTTYRHLGELSLAELTKGIAVKLAFVHDADQLAKIKRHPEFKLRQRPNAPLSIAAKHGEMIGPVMPSFLQSIGRLGGQKRAQKLSPSRRKKIARKAAKTRWRGNRPIPAKAKNEIT